MAPIESVVYPFENVLPELDSIPIAARRALDHAGLRLSQEGWRSLPAEARVDLAMAGGLDDIDVDHVSSVAKSAVPTPQRVTSSGDPDPLTPPEALSRALEPNRLLDARRWAALRAIDRYALAHTYRRAVARSAFSLLGEAFDVILSARPLSPAPPRPSRPPPSVRSPAQSPVPGYYSQSPSDARAITIADLSSHLNANGEAHMVDVGAKTPTARRAIAAGSVHLRPDTARKLASGDAPKGDVLATARIAGIQAAKRTSDLIPLCHVVAITKITVDLRVEIAQGRVDIQATVEAFDRTGVEMEALTAVSVAGLTIYDMLKGLDRTMTIGDIRLLEKTGGKTALKREDRP